MTTPAQAQKLPDGYVSHILLDQPGGIQPAMAAAVVRILWKSTEADLGPDVITWLFDGDVITVQAWNDPDQELAARGFNLLWVSGDYDRICVLIKKGVDCTLSAKAWDGTKREGVWTGYVQPLTHVLGKYVKPIELLGTPQENQLSDIAKVRGAKQVINVLGGLKQPPRILLSYKAIQGCPMITMFQDKPGTIWGFEDVRLPYVQAARETKWGQQPLRMLDMWEAITPALAGYSALIAKPAQTIEECVKKGVEQVRRGIREHAEQYQGMIEEQYIPAYEAQCTSFLTFLVSRLPYSKYLEQPKQTGKDPGKLLPSFACKAGIWWAQSPSQDRPLYYCIDGLNMRDAVNYKAFKTKAINGYLSALGTPAAKLLDLRPFQEVITLAEVREILLNWDDLRKTVRFVEMGRILDVQEAGEWVSGWKAQMAEIDLAAPKRQWREQDVILATAYDLKDDYLLWSSLEPREIRACVREAALLKLMAAGPADMLQMTLDEGCPTLRGLALVPEQFVDLFNQALDVSADDRPVTVSLLRGALFGVCQGLREPLAVAITRLFPPEPLTAPAVLIVDIDLDL